MNRFLRLLCLLACLMLTPLSALAQSAPEAPAPRVRVLLRRLGLTDRAEVYIGGAYTLSTAQGAEMLFPRGSHVTAIVREGELYLFYEGMSMCAGEGLRLTRHAASGDAENGLRFDPEGNLYPGDLALTVQEGALRPILTLSVEDYTMGVVPHEMGEHFPLEALKAQAVCARTYALHRAASSGNRDYDVVDTTNDQVFKGVNSAHVNARRAVRETAGVVGTYRGELTICYYSASNGGQTALVEHAWSGRGDSGVYAVTDDPYDLENPESVVRRALLRRDGARMDEDFLALLASGMRGEMQRRGFTPSAQGLRVDEVLSVTLGAPAFPAPSRLMTQMTVSFRWSGRTQMGLKTITTPVPAPDEELDFFSAPASTPAPTFTPEPVYTDFTPVAEPMTVTLPLFPGAVDALGLAITGSDREMVTVTESEEGFLLEARRFGHGVGMSQRGAQWMAGQYGKLFHEILAFYYPGMTLMQAPAGEAALPALPGALAATAPPPATPTPRPTLMPVTREGMPAGAYMAKVEHIEDDSSLNLRAEPSQGAEILMRLYKHQELMVLETCEDAAWVHVKTDAAEGYVMVSFLERME